jgi:hypothetical protein
MTVNIDGAKFFYVAGQLNYRPELRTLAATKKNFKDSKTSSSVIGVISKLAAVDMEVSQLVSECVDDVVREGSVSECVNTILALLTMGFGKGHVCRLISRLESLVCESTTLTEIDMRQLEKAISILLILDMHMDDIVIMLGRLIYTSGGVLSRPKPTNTSRSHQEVFKCLRVILSGDNTVLSEVFIPQISSYIDIQVS